MTQQSEQPFQQGLDALSNVSKQTHQIPIARGIEKEGLRVDSNNFIAQTDHQKALGHPLTHPAITTDYSEALLELITPVENSIKDLLTDLEQTHQHVLKSIDDELLWAGSMPCKIDGNDSIRIAEYGDSNIGKLKHVYRKGLDVRYGRIMQSIAGLHYNFSLSDEFWESLKSAENAPENLQDYKSKKYFALTRNFRRYSWLLMYLFGASPALDKTFLDGKEGNLESMPDGETLFRPYATSLRMSDLGYHNNAQSSLSICFNTLANFTNTLGEAVKTSYEPYAEIGTQQDGEYIQLNTNILQIENEYYSSIRPKRSTYSGEKPTQALIDRGVEYVEVRCLDLNPFLPLGIDQTQIAFLDTFLLFCLFEDSPFLSDAACQNVENNFATVTNEGRTPGLMLQNGEHFCLLSDWANEIFEKLQPVAQRLDSLSESDLYSSALSQQNEKVRNPELCPSSQVLKALIENNESWSSLAGRLSAQHKANLLSAQLDDQVEEKYRKLAEASFDKEAEIKAADDVSFDQFLEAYMAD